MAFGPTDPMTQPASSTPYIPTGYETMQAEIMRRRALADSMLNHQQSGPMTSPFQALAQVLEAYGGNKLEGRADQQQTQLDQQRLGDYQKHISQFQTDISDPTADQTKVLAKYSTDPYIHNNPLVDALIKAQQKKFENAGEANGAPMNLQVAGLDGKPTMASFQPMKDGTLKPITQGVVPEELMLGPSGQIIGKQSSKIYGVAPDVSKYTTVAADGKTPVANPTQVAGAATVAAAGKPDYHATFVNTGESAYGKAIGEETGKQDAATLQTGRDAPKQYQSAQRIRDLLKQHPITGTGAGARLALDSALATIGITGNGKVTATQNLMAELANTTLANIHTSGLGAGQGFTDKDREFLESAKAGTLNKTPENIDHLAQLNQNAAVESQKAGKRVFERMRTNPATAPMVQGLENDFNVPIGGTPANSGLRSGFTPRVGAPR